MIDLLFKVYLINYLIIYYSFVYRITISMHKKGSFINKGLTRLLAALFFGLILSFSFSLVLGVSLRVNLIALTIMTLVIALQLFLWSKLEKLKNSKIEPYNGLHLKEFKLFLILSSLLMSGSLVCYTTLVWLGTNTLLNTFCIFLVFCVLNFGTYSKAYSYYKQFKDLEYTETTDPFTEAYEKAKESVSKKSNFDSKTEVEPLIIDDVEVDPNKLPLSIVYIDGYGNGDSESWKALTQDEKDAIIDDILKID
jgi:hypothetical protein